MRRSRLFFLVILATMMSGCPRPPDEKTPVVELEPLFITILKTGDKLEVKDFDQSELFARGQEQFEAGEIAKARRTYLLMARESNDAEVKGIAWFNVALCEMSLERPGAAREAVASARPHIQDPETLVHLELIELKSLAALGEWEQVRSRGGEVARKEMAPGWLAQVQLLSGRAEFQAGKLPAADAFFRQSLDTILNNLSLKDQYGNAMLAEIYFRRGQVLRRLFDGLKFKMPLSRMSVDMADKLSLMRQAEEHFLNAVRTRSVEWSPRAGYQNAELYHAFGLDLLQAEVPDDLSDEEVTIYQEELAKKVLPLLRKSQNVHSNNFGMCKTYRFTSPWCDKSKARRTELETFEKDLLRK
jgi:hypothetical protein